MLLTSRAHDLFRQEKYVESLAYYSHLLKSVSFDCFSFNVDLCLKRLALPSLSRLDISKESFTVESSERILSKIAIEIGISIGSKDEHVFLSGLQLLNPKIFFFKKAVYFVENRINDGCLEPKEFKLFDDKDKKTNDYKRIVNWQSNYREELSEMEEILASASPKQKSSAQVANDNNQTNIVYILHNSFPESTGGYATRSHGVATGLKDNGLNLTCITRPGAPWDFMKDVYDFPLEATVDQVTYKRIPKPLRQGIGLREYIHQSKERLKVEIAAINPDLVMAASNHVTALPALLATKELGLPFIYEVRGIWHITRISRDPDYFYDYRYDYENELENFAMVNSDHLFTLTQAMKDKFAIQINATYPDNFITLAPNSCNPNEFIPLPKNLRLLDQLGIRQSSVVIGYIGSFVQYEGLDHLVLACSILKKRNIDFALLLVGSENVTDSSLVGPVTKKIQKIISEHKMENYVKLPGRIAHDDVKDYYSLIDIAPFPRKPQPVCELVSPIKPLEACCMEKAIIVSSVRALTEIVKDRETGLVFNKGDVDDLADKLHELIAQPELRRKLGKKARRWAINERQWITTTAKMGEIIASF